ncbi:MAG: hypothetical protein A3I01_01340 [Betaproteobacteria bacterium RIFCSPLOWO2_02_FULL_65_24]|nr:MAG: hypothetical protein A3I01_01340 [Betaproteobacteria bacterium RIFCSPLOWO2_02_FULL_65_24]OGA96074.1 MAG: hypothetical protein A3G27_05165 [Betaproteobacteria bacterium RIFCSPLOWO2_12_FULL_66_14]
MENKARNPWAAGVLSGVLPGLGQFYNRQWLKGVGFLLGILVVDGVLGVSSDMLEFVQSRALPSSTAEFLFGSLIVLVIAIWSIADAARTAKGSRK